jgi:hypothetical protein
MFAKLEIEQRQRKWSGIVPGIESGFYLAGGGDGPPGGSNGGGKSSPPLRRLIFPDMLSALETLKETDVLVLVWVKYRQHRTERLQARWT